MVYYCRDGVSEGQFYQVLLYELDAIRKVCGLYLLIIYLSASNFNKKVGNKALINNCAGLCFIRTQLPTSGDFHCGAKTTSHKVIRKQPQGSKQHWQKWKRFARYDTVIHVKISTSLYMQGFVPALQWDHYIFDYIYFILRNHSWYEDLPSNRIWFLSLQPCWYSGENQNSKPEMQFRYETADFPGFTIV